MERVPRVFQCTMKQIMKRIGYIIPFVEFLIYLGINFKRILDMVHIVVHAN